MSLFLIPQEHQSSDSEAVQAHVTEMAELCNHWDPVHSDHVPDTAVRSSSGSTIAIAALPVQTVSSLEIAHIPL